MEIELTTLQLKWLLIDYSEDGGYQRKSDLSRYRKIAKNFNPALAAMPLVAKRPDGSYYIVDGNHTINAMKINGVQSTNCRVFESTGREVESPIFVSLNTAGAVRGKNCTPYQVYAAGVSCGVAAYIEIKRLMDMVNVEVSSSKNASKDRLLAIGTLYDIIKCGKNIESTIKFIDKTWPNDDHKWSADMLRGCVFVYSSIIKNGLNEELISKKLAKKNCQFYIERAITVSKAMNTHRRAKIGEVLARFAGIVNES